MVNRISKIPPGNNPTYNPNKENNVYQIKKENGIFEFYARIGREQYTFISSLDKLPGLLKIMASYAKNPELNFQASDLNKFEELIMDLE